MVVCFTLRLAPNGLHPARVGSCCLCLTGVGLTYQEGLVALEKGVFALETANGRTCGSKEGALALHKNMFA